MTRLLMSVLLLFPSCISISTHEQQMKKYRETAAELERVKAELAEKRREEAVLKSEISSVRNTYDELIQELKDDIAKGEVGVTETDKGLTVTMGNQILFASGKAALQPRGKKVLMQVAGIIKKADDRLIQVDGHTDNVRISGPLKSQFPSNWELSSARASSVVRFLQDEGTIAPDRLILTAFAEYRPLADNNTPQGRQQNRRVEITLLPTKP